MSAEAKGCGTSQNQVATCIGCGCTDNRACINEDTGEACHWLAVDYAAGVGVCSKCPDDLDRWEKGDRCNLSAVLAAKITREGETTAFYLEVDDIANFMNHRLEFNIGDRFTLEIVDIPVDQFRLLPQYEDFHLASEWHRANLDVERFTKAGRPDETARCRIIADQIEKRLKEAGEDVREIVDTLREDGVLTDYDDGAILTDRMGSPGGSGFHRGVR